MFGVCPFILTPGMQFGSPLTDRRPTLNAVCMLRPKEAFKHPKLRRTGFLAFSAVVLVMVVVVLVVLVWVIVAVMALLS